jgi:hypothetical protein
MTWDHDRVEEFLAAHALRGLEGEDAELVERALVEHVPRCPRCRPALEAFTELAGELALAAPPVVPPATLQARVRRLWEPVPRPRRGPWAAAVSVAALVLVGLGVWNLSLVGRLGRAETRQAWLTEAVSTVTRPGAGTVSLSGRTPAHVTLMHDASGRDGYLFATRLPRTEDVYRVWFVGAGRRWTPGVLEPDEWGVAMMPVRTDLRRWELVMVIQEGRDRAPSPEASPLVSARMEG